MLDYDLLSLNIDYILWRWKNCWKKEENSSECKIEILFLSHHIFQMKGSENLLIFISKYQIINITNVSEYVRFTFTSQFTIIFRHPDCLSSRIVDLNVLDPQPSSTWSTQFYLWSFPGTFKMSNKSRIVNKFTSIFTIFLINNKMMIPTCF